ncbi:8-amino-7-oxononanoate synthase [Entomortierella parvispora]|uniref:8-amino-7-oxononanoate synthase n=1 Tax=Entomortierella parvispora TaxID=205924 RepID=A0A9P3LZU5_9FUNG|nr:8-amino-7-oxononanoate synthase [Entomortierella parvispora]
MATQIERQLQKQLESRKARSLLRSLVVIPDTSADFSSNDFLGLARNSRLNARFLKELASFPVHSPPLGSTGSRLLDGNSKYAEDLEILIARFHGAEAALIFNSGFDANVGFFSSVPQPGDVILYDEFIHASVHDGMKVTRAGLKTSFLHNDLEHLGRLLEQVKQEDEAKERTSTTSNTIRRRNVFVAVESVYSMDGDTAPLREIVDLLEPYGAHLIVDEAHATGVYGVNGRGLVNELGLEDKVFARLHTFSKSLASNGAAMVGPKVLKDYLINYARPLIYSTFTSFSNLASVKSAYEMLMAGETVELVDKVQELIRYFRSNIQLPEHMLLPSTSPIQGIVMDGNAKVNALSQELIRAGLNVKPIRFPTVPKGKERVRICLHSHNTLEQVSKLIRIAQDWIRRDEARAAVATAAAKATATVVDQISIPALLTAQPSDSTTANASSTAPSSSSPASSSSSASSQSPQPTSGESPLSMSAVSATLTRPFPAKL